MREVLGFIFIICLAVLSVNGFGIALYVAFGTPSHDVVQFSLESTVIACAVMYTCVFIQVSCNVWKKYANR